VSYGPAQARAGAPSNSAVQSGARQVQQLLCFTQRSAVEHAGLPTGHTDVVLQTAAA